MLCPHCSGEIEASDIARYLASLRTNAGAPRKRSRCPCGANTMKRAKSRSFECCRKARVAVPPTPIAG